MNNTYQFDDLEASDFPSNFDITHAISLGVSYTGRSLRISAGFNWHSGKPTTQPIEGNEITDDLINYDSTNKDKLDEYMRLDVSAMYDFNVSNNVKCNLGVSVWNALNRENQINNFYRINNDVVNENVQRSLGITPNAILRVNF